MFIETKNDYIIKVVEENDYKIVYILDKFDGTSIKLEMYKNQINQLINELSDENRK